MRRRARTNTAVTDLTRSTVRVHRRRPEQAPLHSWNSDPRAAAARRVTRVPALYASQQSRPQAMPGGSLVTRPRPRPFLVTDSENDDAVSKNTATDRARLTANVD